MHKAWWLGGVGLLVVAAALGAAKVSGVVAFGAKDAPKVEPTLEFTPREVVQPTPGRWMHHLELGDPDDVDAEVVRWLEEAARDAD